MFDTHSPIVKVVGYIIIGFFALIIIISFGMPDFISRMGLDRSTVAIVNGEKIHRLDFIRYRDDRFRDLRGDKMQAMILNYYISDVLLLQKAKNLGIDITDDAIRDYIHNNTGLRDPRTGKFDSERLKFYLERSHRSFKDFYKLVRNDLIREELIKTIRLGNALSTNDIKQSYIAGNSTIQIRYAYLSSSALAKRFAGRTTVTDDEIDQEMKKNKKEIKDPKSDRKRIGEKLKSRKLQTLKKELINQINAVAKRGGPFNEAAAILRGKVSLSKKIKIGEQLRDISGKGMRLYGIESSKEYSERFFQIKKNTSSRAISSATGIYIFTPVIVNIKKGPIPEEKLAPLAQKMENENLRMAVNNMMLKMQEKSRIIRLLKKEKK